MKTPPGLGMMLLSIWLVIFGLLLMPSLAISFRYSHDLLGIFAIVVGVLLFLKR